MPFGLANGPAVFQRFIQSVLHEYLGVFCFVYLDDILIFSSSDEEHEEHVKLILAKLREHKLQASPEKCEFFKTEVVFLGFIISVDGLRMDPSKLETLTKWPYPKNLAEIRRFVGFANFYRRFISKFSSHVSRLTELTKNGANVQEGLKDVRTKKGFAILINAFSSAPFLQHFDFALPRVLHIDASAYAFSAILSQPDEKGALRPVCYYSKKLTPEEHNWQTHDQELGAIVATFKEWYSWLMGANEKILVFSDHANLRYFMESRSLTPRQARWAAFLSAFDFVIMHTPGKMNAADPASRRPDFINEVSEDRALVLFKSVPVESTNINVIELGTFSSVVNFSFAEPEADTLDFIKSGYKFDSFISDAAQKSLIWRDDCWWLRGRLYVPLICREYLLQLYHARPTVGHWGTAKTLDLISRSFCWPNMRIDILRLIKFCVSCQKVNRDLRAPQGSLVPLPVPSRPWSTVGVDFIVKLPLSNDFDSIMVVVDHFSKASHFIRAKETWSTMQMADAFVDNIFRLHGLPDKIVSDRGTVFVSNFWKAVCSRLSIEVAPSTAFHPQTDGQVERINAVLEDYLRHFVSERQNDWVQWLSLAEFAFNNSASSSTGLSPFFANFGFHPRFDNTIGASLVPKADIFVEHLQVIQEHLQVQLVLAKDRQKKFYDSGRRVDTVYSPGDLVWLSRKFIKTRRPSQKLDFRRIGPFAVVRMVGKNAVELQLSQAFARLHPVFNISLISPFYQSDNDSDLFQKDLPANALPTDSDAVKFLTNWIAISHILGHRVIRGEHFYLLRSTGSLSNENDVWTPLLDISRNLDPFIQQYHLIHWEDSRPPWNLFISPLRSDMGFTAKKY